MLSLLLFNMPNKFDSFYTFNFETKHSKVMDSYKTLMFFRCLFNASLTEEGRKTQLPPMDSAEFAALAQKDLVMNVYRDGHWGSFRHLPFASGNYHQVHVY